MARGGKGKGYKRKSQRPNRPPGQRHDNNGNTCNEKNDANPNPNCSTTTGSLSISGSSGGWKKHIGSKDMHNQKMVLYYSAQPGVFSNTSFSSNTENGDDDDDITDGSTSNGNEDQAEFFATMRRPLPASFRIGADVPQRFVSNLVQELEQFTSGSVRKSSSEDGPDDHELVEIAAAAAELKMRPISFVPNSYQFQTLDRKRMRREAHLSSFHSWLVTNTTNGFITRQETVSMLPPVALDIQPHHRVLDMCAAPGSKTAQMLEIIASSSSSKDQQQVQHGEEKERQQGFIVANDADAKRAYMLTRQLRRLNSPNIFICSVDARFFPNVNSKVKGVKTQGFFDRVLCDVPCGGDGTVRKNPQIWRNWQNNNSMALHPVQLSIAIRGLCLTKSNGGYMCYSTCSINPIENEAVVCELLRRHGKSIRLLDVRSKFEKLGFVGRPGLKNWKVLCEKSTRKSNKRRQQMEEWKAVEKESGDNQDNDKPTHNNVLSESEENGKNGEEKQKLEERTENGKESEVNLFANHYNEYSCIDEVPPNNQKIHKSMFPPKPKTEESKFHLEYCMRVHPQDNDTGGFFVALFEKFDVLDFESAKEKMSGDDASKDAIDKNININVDVSDDRSPAPKKVKVSIDKHAETNDTNAMENDTRSNTLPSSEAVTEHNAKPRKVKTDLGNLPFIPVDSMSWKIIWPELRDFYGLDESLFPIDQVKARADGETKCLYFSTKEINDTLLMSEFQKRVVVINTGLKIFSKNTRQSNARYRLNQEGVHCIIPFMDGRRKMLVELKDYSLMVDKALFLLLQNKESKDKSNNLNIYLEHRSDEIDDAGETNAKTILDESFSTSFIDKVRQLDGIGSFAVLLNGHENDILNSKMAMVFWKCRQDCINILVARDEIEGIQSKLRAL